MNNKMLFYCFWEKNFIVPHCEKFEFGVPIFMSLFGNIESIKYHLLSFFLGIFFDPPLLFGIVMLLFSLL